MLTCPSCQYCAVPGSACMGGSGRLLVVVWVSAHILACAARSHVAAPEECVQCFTENRRLADRIEQLLVRVGQLEAELAGARADGRGTCATTEQLATTRLPA
jgi:hypothetical protein